MKILLNELDIIVVKLDLNSKFKQYTFLLTFDKVVHAEITN